MPYKFAVAGAIGFALPVVGASYLQMIPGGGLGLIVVGALLVAVPYFAHLDSGWAAAALAGAGGGVLLAGIMSFLPSIAPGASVTA